MKNKEEIEIELEYRRIKQQELSTEVKKDGFINEIKNGLGQLIKEEPNKIQKKVGFWGKLMKILK
jgi:hypothetical protein